MISPYRPSQKRSPSPTDSSITLATSHVIWLDNDHTSTSSYEDTDADSDEFRLNSRMNWRSRCAQPLSPVRPRWANSVPTLALFPRTHVLPTCLHWLADIQVEVYGKRRLLWTFILWLICGWINVIACNIADSRRSLLPTHNIPIDSRLPDLGHEYLPDWSTSKHPIPDYFVIVSVVFTLIMLWFHKHRLALLRRYFFTHSLLLIYRSITINVTTIPDPQLRCMHRTLPTPIFRNVNPLFPDTCGDLIFSGHTIILTLVALAWDQYGPQYLSVKRAMSALCLVGMSSLIAARYHYTVDVVLSVALTWLVWHLYGSSRTCNGQFSSTHVAVVKALERRSSLEFVSSLGKKRVVPLKTRTRRKIDPWPPRRTSGAMQISPRTTQSGI